MPVDYNLIVIGSSTAGILAAKTAVQQRARVALVTQDEPWDALPSCLAYLKSLTPPVDWTQVARYFKLICAQQQAQDSPDRLASLGIDVILGTGSFRRRSGRRTFHVADRVLTAHRYQVATSLPKTNPDQDDEWTIANFPTQLAKLANVQHLLVLGSSRSAVALSQALVRLGIAVTLVTETGSILPDTIAPVLVNNIKAQLEADGVKIHTCAPIVKADAVLLGDEARDSSSASIITPTSPTLITLGEQRLTRSMDPSGQCQISLKRNGTIVGAQIWHESAEVWAGILGLAIQQKMTIAQLAQLTESSTSAGLTDLARDYEQQHRSAIRDYALEEFFSWRRYWGR
jgi:pyruvate/2-oxoglutarate dehydrogenase complex dihydrolipoamide dehydrogenase (E3) component